MLRTRLVTAVILIPIVVYCIYLGELPFLTLVALLLTLAVIEFCRLMAQAGYRPVMAFGIGLVWLCLLDARFPSVGLLQPGLVLILLSSLTWQLFHHPSSKVANWALTVTGGLYIGLCGACLIKLRGLHPDGLWWTLTVVPAISFADSGAYLVGSAWGRHKLAPTLSAGKTWEGYVAGVVIGGLMTALLASFWRTQAGAGTSVSGMHGLILGLLIAIFAPLGDLAISMIKRQAGAKDSGQLFPGHGGVLDRVDSVLWTAVIGYYYVLWLTM